MSIKMFNFVNRHDFIDGLNLLVKQPRVLKRLFLGTSNRVVEQWESIIDTTPVNKVLNERTNLLISGDKDISRYQYTAKKYLSKGGLIAASLGCGNGEHEMKWGQQGVFAQIDAIDLASSRIKRAQEKAREAGLQSVCNFIAGDFAQILNTEKKYDVIIFESSLHHFSSMDEIVSQVSQSLKADGLVLLFDFVGPTKWQWLPAQLTLVNEMIDMLPEKYKLITPGNKLKKRFKPSLLRMYLMDPSEAIESSNILPALNKEFEALEVKNAGGTLLCHFLPKIQHNFDCENVEDMKWLNRLIQIENDILENVDQFGIWYCYGVFKKNANYS